MECDLLFCIQLNNSEAHKKKKIIFNFEYCKKPQHFFCCGFCLLPV